MNLYKILKIVAGLLGLAGIIFLIMIIAKGDDAITAAALDGDTSIMDPITYVTYIIFALTIGFVLFFVIQNLFVKTDTLKSALIGAGAFLAILIVSYMVSSGADAGNYIYDGASVTENESRLVSAGLVSFYILIIVAAGTLVWAGLKNLSK